MARTSAKNGKVVSATSGVGPKSNLQPVEVSPGGDSARRSMRSVQNTVLISVQSTVLISDTSIAHIG